MSKRDSARKRPADRHLDVPSDANRDKHINFVALENDDTDPSDDLSTGKLADERTRNKNLPAPEHKEKKERGNLKNVRMSNSKHSAASGKSAAERRKSRRKNENLIPGDSAPQNHKRSNNPRNLTENVNTAADTDINENKDMWREWKDKDLTDQ